MRRQANNGRSEQKSADEQAIDRISLNVWLTSCPQSHSKQKMMHNIFKRQSVQVVRDTCAA